jgi:hypothetical protein
MRYCLRCGTAAAAQQAFCVSCGARLEPTAEPQAPTPAAGPPPDAWSPSAPAGTGPQSPAWPGTTPAAGTEPAAAAGWSPPRQGPGAEPWGSAQPPSRRSARRTGALITIAALVLVLGGGAVAGWKLLGPKAHHVAGSRGRRRDSRGAGREHGGVRVAGLGIAGQRDPGRAPGRGSRRRGRQPAGQRAAGRGVPRNLLSGHQHQQLQCLLRPVRAIPAADPPAVRQRLRVDERLGRGAHRDLRHPGRPGRGRELHQPSGARRQPDRYVLYLMEHHALSAAGRHHVPDRAAAGWIPRAVPGLLTPRGEPARFTP